MRMTFAHAGGAVCNNENSNGTVVNCTFDGNYVQHVTTSVNCGGGAIANFVSSPFIFNCKFYSNQAIFSENVPYIDMGGGALLNCGYSCPTIIDCYFRDNKTIYTGTGEPAGDGGAINNNLVVYASGSVIINCVFLRNRSCANGGAISTNQSGVYFVPVVNSTFRENYSARKGGAVYLKDVAPGIASFKNSIFWANSSGTSQGKEFYNENSTPAVEYCDIDGFTNGSWCGGSAPSVGSGMMDQNPLFADDFYLLNSGSPCKDAGNNALVPNDVYDMDNDGNTAEKVPDVDLNERIVPEGGTVDLGAAEVQ